jgi:hypothetical protein
VIGLYTPIPLCLLLRNSLSAAGGDACLRSQPLHLSRERCGGPRYSHAYLGLLGGEMNTELPYGLCILLDKVM